MNNKRFKVIACNVMWREICYYAARSPNAFSLQFLDWGLHTDPDQLRRDVQQAIDSTEDRFDAILLGYGLCSNGIRGIMACGTKLVIAKSHDCITYFLGSKDRYRDYFQANPGVYWYTPGWIENHPAPGQERYEKTYRHYLQKYGEDNATYLMEMEQGWFRSYTAAAYVDLGVGNTSQYKEYTRQCANWLGWRFEKLQGDAGLIERMLNGDWRSDDFLIIEPGYMTEATNREDIIASVSAEPYHEQVATSNMIKPDS